MLTLSDKKVYDFIDELASGAPTPGGGGGTALVAALGVALGNMVANLTIGKKKYSDVEDSMIELSAEATKLQNEFLDLVEKDAEAFAPLADAYRLPADTEEEKSIKENAIQESLITAAKVPLETMNKCARGIELLEDFARMGSNIVLSDAACGAIFCRAALEASWINVCVNTSLMHDESVKESFSSEGIALLEEYIVRAETVYGEIAMALVTD